VNAFRTHPLAHEYLIVIKTLGISVENVDLRVISNTYAQVSTLAKFDCINSMSRLERIVVEVDPFDM
jgi:hypothetical protein